MMSQGEFRLELPGFAGTLEDLVLASQRDRAFLRTLPLEPLARQLLAYLQHAGKSLPLDRRIEWADLAALLIRWKSFLLLPGDPAGQQAAAAELRAEMEAKFSEIERAYLEHLRDVLLERLLATGGQLETEPQLEKFRPQAEESALFPSLWTLRKKFQTLRDRARQHRQNEQAAAEHLRVQRDQVTVLEMAAWLEAQLQNVPPGQLVPVDTLFEQAGSLPRQIALFLAMLSLAQQRRLKLEQRQSIHSTAAERPESLYLSFTALPG